MWYDPPAPRMRRYSSPYASSFSFGPGPLSTALKALIGANVVIFLATFVASSLTVTLGTLALTDFYIMGLAAGWYSDLRLIG